MSSSHQQPVAVYRKDYRKPEFNINSVHLDFHIVDGDDVTVINTLQMQRVNADTTTPLVLDGEALELLSLALDDVTLSPQDYAINAESLTIHHVPHQFKLVLQTKINPKANTLLSGLYYADGLFCTQCESQGFRRITYYLDRPDVLSRFTVTIHADRTKYPVLLSNGNCVAQDDDSVTWEDPFKKPCYLFALVVGDLACVKDTFTTCSGRKVALDFYVEHGNEDKTACAIESLKHSMRWDEEKFGREYDLDIYMIVAVRSFNMGAMENKGLNIFNVKYVLASPESASDADYFGIERVIGHEYFHNWTGNRVTCQDWFQLSLKEGLTVFRDQEFSRDMQGSSVCRIQNVKTLRSMQFSEDASPMAHPVRPESYIEINNFYTTTVYDKGAEVIRMQHTLLGEAGFRKGMDLYFERHDGQAVTIDDFVKAMENANSRDLTQFKRWYSQSGTPEITVQSSVYDADKKQFSLTLSQSCPPTPGQPTKEPFHIPIALALWNQDGKAMAIPESVIELKEPQQTWVWSNIASKPVVSLLRDFSAPVKLHMDYTDEELALLINAENNDFACWEATQRLIYKYLLDLNDKKTLPTSLLNVFTNIINNKNINLLLKAELLTLPNFIECSQMVSIIDVDAIESSRDLFHTHIGQANQHAFHDIYSTLNAKSSSDMTAEAYGQRRLKNVCLMYLVYAKHPDAKKLALAQLKQAKNMTDEASALVALMFVDEATRDEATTLFYHKWQHNDLVLDKWFATQAISPLPSTLDNIKVLMHHPAFDRKNPNKVRALLSSFWMHNPRAFHALDNSGYQFFVEQILLFDKDNAFMSSHLARSMMNWKRFDTARQTLMQNALSTILNNQKLSKDLYEIVSKALA